MRPSAALAPVWLEPGARLATLRAMKITLRSHHAAIGDDLQAHAEKKLSRLERYLPRLGNAVVEVEREETRAAAHRFAVQVTVHAAGAILRAEERAADARTAFDLAAGVLSRQAQRHGKRLRDRWHGAAAGKPAPAPEPAEEAVEEYRGGRVVRVKRFEAKPMSRDEALAQMDLLGHDFYLYLDSATGDYAVLYKRRDGDFGVLEPERAR